MTASGQVVTADAGGSVVSIDPNSGNRTVLSLSGTAGATLTYPYGIAVDANGNLLVTDPGDPAFHTTSTLFSLDPNTGVYSVLAANGVTGGVDFNQVDIGLAVYHGASAVPEPSSLLLMRVGMTGLMLPVWRRKPLQQKSPRD